jgi:Tfp pilus assembly PilM family ATPase
MAKTPTSATGIDIGHFSIKAVSLQKKGRDNYIVTGYSNILVDGELDTAEELGMYLKQTLKRLGAPSKALGLAVDDTEAILKNVEQPVTPLPVLREALKLNGKTILDQDIEEMVLDASENEPTPAKENAEDDEDAPPPQPQARQRGQGKAQYMVAGLPSARVETLWSAAGKQKITPRSLQLSALAICNCFELTRPDVYHNNSFMLVDIGHVDTNLMMVSRGEVVLVRKVDYSGKGLINYIASDTSYSPDQIMEMVQEENPEILQTAETFMSGLAREITNSIGYYESIRDQAVQNVYICGGLAASQPLLESLVNYIDVPCELWKPLENCDVKLRDKMKEAFEADFINLAAAAGAAFQQFIPTTTEKKPAKK